MHYAALNIQWSPFDILWNMHNLFNTCPQNGRRGVSMRLDSCGHAPCVPQCRNKWGKKKIPFSPTPCCLIDFTWRLCVCFSPLSRFLRQLLCKQSWSDKQKASASNHFIADPHPVFISLKFPHLQQTHFHFSDVIQSLSLKISNWLSCPFLRTYLWKALTGPSQASSLQPFGLGVM